jgi:hypothetical protein
MNSPSGRGTRGRPFAPGNGGRPPGSKNKSTQIAAALLEGDREALLRKGLELAKRGNERLLIFFLSRLLPRDRLISFDLPEIISASDARGALQSILRAVSTGVISSAEGAALTALIAPLMHEVAEKPSSRELTPSLADHLAIAR